MTDVPRIRRAYTLVEIVTVTAILVVLAAILLPVFRSAMHATRQSASVSNLRQQFLAVEIYRQGHDGLAQGDMYEMGLPPLEVYAEPTFMGLDPRQRLSPCGRHPEIPGSNKGGSYQYWPSPPGETPSWRDKVQRYGGNTPLVTDFNCSPPDVPLGATFLRRRGIGVMLDGHIVNRSAPGDLEDPAWWGKEWR